MHEYSLVQALLDRIENEARRHRASAVKHVRVSIGALSGVETELFSTAYEICRDGTLCATADLEILPIEANWTCPLCGADIVQDDELTCGACQVPATLAAGGDLILERIELEVPDV